MMQIRFCSDDSNEVGEPQCASETEIDEYIDGITVATWVIQSKIDFSNYKPDKMVIDVMEKYSEKILQKDITQDQIMFSRSNDLKSVESWIPLFGAIYDEFFDINKVLETTHSMSFFSKITEK